MSTENSVEQFGADSFSDAFYPLYKTLFDEEGDFTASIEKKLAQARMPQTAEMYLSQALAIGVVAGLLLWLVGTLGVFMVFELFVEGTPILLGLPLTGETLALVNAVKVPALILVGGVVFGAVGFGAGFGALLGVPYMKAGERKRNINVLLSDATSFMYALSVGGLNQLEILEAIAQADDTYGEVSMEFKAIIRETQYFDTDYRTAIQNQSERTPSDELSQFLTDMLSIVNSGGNMTQFLEDQKNKQMRTSKQEQETILETLELFGEMFMTLSLFPLLLLIILVIMSMMGQSQTQLLYVTVYGLIPLIGGAFLVMISTVVQDEVGDGYLREENGRTRDDEGLFSLGLVERYTGEYSVFDRVKSREGTYETMQMLRRPHIFFRDHPLTVLFITLPATLVFVAFAVLGGWAPLSVEAMKDAPVRGTFFWLYLPLYVNCVPLAFFHEWNVRHRNSIMGKLSENLRKLSSANDTGMTLLESIKSVSETSTGRLADELDTMHAKVNYGTSLKDALYEFNNKYHVPRLARTVKLIAKAQEASSQITAVLSTAAQASENQDDIARDRKSRTRMQVVIIVMTFLTLLAVMAILKVRFLGEIAGLAESTAGGGGSSAAASGAPGGLGGGGLAENVDVPLLDMLFFHAVTFQAIVSGIVAGYIRDVSILAGVKFLVVLPTFALLVFLFI
ncbi:type II secretion system F family protein [Halomarina oriensis]|uniref:Flagella assembly protein j n=1 Tax=Halomarina oriensis TaxID=671145 RepID=A0A6B0GIR6_9EURY|nr:type II secretion system F family protein [Halomarina oriensis]MWG33359.1 flagella assembly protein j [Halomarina oriensis]